MMPLVTCGFTTFNSEDTIIRALESALNQDYKNTELIIVDDCSQDLTLEIINSFLLKKNTSYKIIKHNSNLGVAAARNTLLKNSNGEFLAFFDSDDFSFSERISNQLYLIREFEKNNADNKNNISNSPLCFSDREVIFEDNTKIYCNAMYISKKDLQNKDSNIGALLFCNPFPKNSRAGSTATCMLMARTRTLNFLKGFNPKLKRYEDLDLAIRALMNNVPITTVTKPLIMQYFSKKDYKTNEDSYQLKIIYEYRNWLNKKGLYKFAYYYVKLKQHFFRFNILFLIYYACKLIFNRPFLFFLKIKSSLNTLLFSIRFRLNKRFF